MPNKTILSLQKQILELLLLYQTFLNLYHKLLILKRIYHKNYLIISRESEVQIEAVIFCKKAKPLVL